MEMKEMSIKDKLVKAQRLGWEVTQQPVISQVVEDMAWVHAEGHRAARIQSCIQGHCSIATLLAFDLEEEERELDKEILAFEEELRKWKGKEVHANMTKRNR